MLPRGGHAQAVGIPAPAAAPEFLVGGTEEAESQFSSPMAATAQLCASGTAGSHGEFDAALQKHRQPVDAGGGVQEKQARIIF